MQEQRKNQIIVLNLENSNFIWQKELDFQKDKKIHQNLKGGLPQNCFESVEWIFVIDFFYCAKLHLPKLKFRGVEIAKFSICPRTSNWP